MSFTVDVLLQEYYKSGRMLVKLAEAIGRLVLAGRELTRLAGFTARVTELLTVLKDLNNGRYQRTMVSTENGDLLIIYYYYYYYYYYYNLFTYFCR